MNIIYSTNNNYKHYLFISLLSLVSNTKKRDINVYILYTDLEKNFQNRFNQFFSPFGINIFFIKIDDTYFQNITYKVDNRISIEAYYRIFIGHILPMDESRAIYLDCDTIINVPIEQLYYEDLQGNIIGAVEDILRYTKDFHIFINNLSLKKNNYFNSGLLLIDLNKWKSSSITERCIDFMHNQKEKIIFHDQDVLNAILSDTWLELDYSWNVQTHFVQLPNIYLKAFEHPKLIHYLGIKPDEDNCIHPLKEYFYVYKNYLSSKGLI